MKPQDTAATLVVEALEAHGFREVNRRPDGKVYMASDEGEWIGYLIDDFGGIMVWTVEEEDD